MPSLVRCPQCSAIVVLPAPLKLGQKLDCPHCRPPESSAPPLPASPAEVRLPPAAPAKASPPQQPLLAELVNQPDAAAGTCATAPGSTAVPAEGNARSAVAPRRSALRPRLLPVAAASAAIGACLIGAVLWTNWSAERAMSRAAPPVGEPSAGGPSAGEPPAAPPPERPIPDVQPNRAHPGNAPADDAPTDDAPAAELPWNVVKEPPREDAAPRDDESEAADPSFDVSDFSRPGEASRFRYDWRTDALYSYKYSCDLKVDGQNQTPLTGYALYSSSGREVVRDAPDAVESTSTAFVVDPDGYLLTCAHCVENAKRIVVHLNGREYRGRVLALDAAHDLAVVKISARDLPTVALGVHREAALAQDVRAAGYPLSDVLGSSLKITQGSIAGFVEVDGNRLYQVDASINSGNSGGPIFDDSGAVLGVTSAKLEGTEVTNVGFAVPIDVALPLLRYAGASYATATSTAKLEGAELGRLVAPPVAFLEVTHSVARRSVFQLAVTYDLGWDQRHCTLLVDDAGRPIACDGVGQLPAFVGPSWALGIETLPQGDDARWGSTDQTLLQFFVPEEQPADPFADALDSFEDLRNLDGWDNPLLPRGLGGLLGRPQRYVIVEIPAVQTVQYRIEEETSAELRVHKSIELRTSAGAAGDFALSMSGEGIWRFDPRAGVPLGLQLDGRVVVRTNDSESHIEYAFACARDEDDAPSPPAEVAEAPAPAPLSPHDEVLACIATIRGFRESDAALNAVGVACHNLELAARRDPSWNDPATRKLPAPELQDEVRSALREFIEYTISAKIYQLGTDSQEAIDALVLWGKPEDGELIERSVERWRSEENVSMLRSSLLALASFATLERARQVASFAGSRNMRETCSASLVAFGAMAEPAVIPLLDDADLEVRKLAVKILKQIGTAESVAAIQRRIRVEEDKELCRLLGAARYEIGQRMRSQPAVAAPPAPLPPAPVAPSTPPAGQPAAPPAQADPAHPRGQSPEEDAVREDLTILREFHRDTDSFHAAGMACWELEVAVESARAARGDSDRTLPAPELQDEVREALREFLEFMMTLEDTSEFGVAYTAIHALALWGKPDDGELIDRCLDRWEGTEQRSMIESSLHALGYFPTRERAERVAAYLREPGLRSACERSLKMIGGVAEPAVLPFLSDRNSDVRLRAVELLREIGTRDSIEPLQDLWRKEETSFIRSQIEHALRMIRERI